MSGRNKTYTDLKSFLSIVKVLEIHHDVRVTVNNDNNTVLGVKDGQTVAQWFSTSGFINEDFVKLVEAQKV